ncbi:CoA-binding protein [Planctomycetota bacterium]
MTWKNPPDEQIRLLLESAKIIAVVGCSPKPERTSHQVAAVMQEAGYRVVPVHPKGGTILGETVYPDLLSIPTDTPVDIVNVFLRSETVTPVAEAAVKIKARGLWLQQGVVNEEAWRIATDAGLTCVMDRCIKVLHAVLLKAST